MAKVAIFVCNGSEDIETVAPADILRRAGAEVDIVTIEEDPIVNLGRGSKLLPNLALRDARLDDYDAFVIPGGDIWEFETETAALLRDFFIKNFDNQKLLFAAICAAPHILYHWGLLENKKVTSFPGIEKEAFEAEHTGNRVEIDGNLITANGPGASFLFAHAIVSKLFGKAKADEVLENMQAVL
ncbi:MAG: DJ-1/PfpI family protein [Bifidobacteriaceae bacterium]|jgi:4-methyl-5(b-hydroxyethyl)-thiazole monophosphate biosynthesis|nr:DJ-1/PfpI family protein [Bifidobacteriaceae bacterium]